MNQLKIEVFNYKTIEKIEADLSGFDIVIFEGNNGMGKSSIINGILENFMAKSISTTPLTQGEKEGEKRITTKDNTGEEITVIHTFNKDNPSGTFWAMKNGKSIKSVNEIRELLGQVNTMTIDELFQMCKNVDGRRKFIKTYLYQGLTSIQQLQLQSIEESIKPRTGSIVQKRLSVKQTIDTLETIIKNNLTEDELKLIQFKETYLQANIVEQNKLQELNSLTSRYATCNNQLQAIKKYIPEILMDKYLILEVESEKLFVETEKQQKEKEVYYNDRVKPKMDMLNTAIIKANQLDTQSIQLSQEQVNLDAINKELEKLTKQKEDILRNVILPEGVVIHSESDFSINGLDFSQADISESEAWMLLAELTIKQFPASYMKMGSASLYNREKLNKLAELANKYNKIIALERVVEDIEDISVVGRIVDDMTNHEIKLVFEGNRGSIISDEVNIPAKEDNAKTTTPDKKEEGIKERD